MRITRLKLLVLVVMSLFGLGAALEVFFAYYLLGQSLPGCQPGGFFDCSRVLGSTYSQIFGIPLELFAAAYFIINLGLVYLIAFGSDRVFQRAINAIFIWRFLGLMIVPYLVFVELVIIHAICIYCTMMHIAIVADFIIISYLLFYKGGIGAQVGLEPLPEEGLGASPSISRGLDSRCQTVPRSIARLNQAAGRHPVAQWRPAEVALGSIAELPSAGVRRVSPSRERP